MSMITYLPPFRQFGRIVQQTRRNHEQERGPRDTCRAEKNPNQRRSRERSSNAFGNTSDNGFFIEVTQHVAIAAKMASMATLMAFFTGTSSSSAEAPIPRGALMCPAWVSHTANGRKPVSTSLRMLLRGPVPRLGAKHLKEPRLYTTDGPARGVAWCGPAAVFPFDVG